MKRVLSLTLAICLVVGCTIVQATAASSGQVQKSLESVLEDFPVGSYFTTDGKKGSASELTKIMDARGLDSTEYDRSYTCVGFAKYVWAKVFNHSVTSSYREEYSSGRAGLKNTWSNAKVGDLVYFYKNSDLKIHNEYPKNDPRYDPHLHAAIIWNISDTGVTLYDCNYKGRNQIGLYTVTFGESGWPKSYCRLYHAKNYDIINNSANVTPKITFTVYFNPNGGTVNQTTKTVTEGSSVGPMPTPTRSGYTFLGWSTAQEGSGMILRTGEELFVNSDMTLYAVWKENMPIHTTHEKGDYTIGTEHPHKIFYTCPVCGEVFTDGSTVSQPNSCGTCFLAEIGNVGTSVVPVPDPEPQPEPDPEPSRAYWGTWSEWSSTRYYSSDTREVETRQVNTSDGYTEYRYGRYIDGTGGHIAWCADNLAHHMKLNIAIGIGLVVKAKSPKTVRPKSRAVLLNKSIDCKDS